ncbi:MAG: MaoC family dehydratase [Solirubrobacterales bacterium]
MPTPDLIHATSADDLFALEGRELGPTRWVGIAQEQIDAFAELTGDHQWIHTDPERAAASEFGSTVAHGLMTLAFGPMLMYELIAFDGFAHELNYGYEKVRFTAPLPVDSRVRMTATVVSVARAGAGIKVVARQIFEREGQDRPVCVADAIARVAEGD